MSRILVTGATGLLGRETVRLLTEAGHEVFALVRSNHDFPEPRPKQLNIDFGSFDRSRLPSDVDSVIHLAQSDKFRDFPFSAEEVMTTNLGSTVRLLDWARETGVKHFVVASTGGVYRDSTLANEQSGVLKQPGELDFYFSTKLSSEAFAQCYLPYFSVAILRFFFIYGKHQNRGMLLPRIFDRVKSGVEVLLDGPNGFSLNPVHVSDAARAVVASMHNPSSLVANIAGPHILTLRQISNFVAEYLNKPAVFRETGNSSLDVVGDIDLMKAKLYAPTISFSERLSDLAD